MQLGVVVPTGVVVVVLVPARVVMVVVMLVMGAGRPAGLVRAGNGRRGTANDG
jgi:hypothetical protein